MRHGQRREYLECGHCGGAAIESDDDGLFGDGDGVRCDHCWFPGTVSADEGTALWVESDWPGDVCEDPTCRECIRPARREFSVRCVNCGNPTPVERYCYIHPACYECLPPPEPLPVAPMSNEAKRLLGRDQ